MSWRVAGLLAYVIIAAVVGITSTIVVGAMVDEVNRNRPPADHISALGWYPGKMGTVVALYRQAYPNGRRHIQLAILVGVGVLGFVLAAVCLVLPS
jgi:MFS-type transporter involved in bile tolerance (Atg22 family)